MWYASVKAICSRLGRRAAGALAANKLKAKSNDVSAVTPAPI
jgi:hypothetical protein